MTVQIGCILLLGGIVVFTGLLENTLEIEHVLPDLVRTVVRDIFLELFIDIPGQIRCHHGVLHGGFDGDHQGFLLDSSLDGGTDGLGHSGLLHGKPVRIDRHVPVLLFFILQKRDKLSGKSEDGRPPWLAGVVADIFINSHRLLTCNLDRHVEKVDKEV